MGNCHFKSDFDAENFTGKLASNTSLNVHNEIPVKRRTTDGLK